MYFTMLFVTETVNVHIISRHLVQGEPSDSWKCICIHRLLLTEHVVLFEKTFKQRLKLFAFKIKLKDKLGAKRLKFVSICLQVVKFFLRRVHPAFYVKL